MTIYPTSVLRNVSCAKYQESTGKSTPLTKASEEKASIMENKSSLTVALEDYTKIVIGRDDDGRQLVGPKTVKEGIWEGVCKFFGSKKENPNVFKKDAVREDINNGKMYTQTDVMREHIDKEGGLLYSKEGDDLYKSALNYAKADIGAIEDSYSKAYATCDGKPNKNSKLDSCEISSYERIDRDRSKDHIKEMDIDGDGEISDKEYASYTIVADGLVKNGDKYDFNVSNCDGKVTQEEAKGVDEVKTSTLRGWATEVYRNKYEK